MAPARRPASAHVCAAVLPFEPLGLRRLLGCLAGDAAAGTVYASCSRYLTRLPTCLQTATLCQWTPEAQA